MGIDAPYREGSPKLLCRDCREPAIGACLRCGAPLCKYHGVGAEERCARCEEGYNDRLRRLKLGGGITVTVLAVSAWLLGRAGLMFPGLAVIFIVLLVFMMVFFPIFVLPAYRQRFMRQRPKPERAPFR